MNSRGLIPIIWIIAIVASIFIVTSVIEQRKETSNPTDQINR